MIEEYNRCEKEILEKYTKNKYAIDTDDKLLCSYIGNFNNNILSSTISLIEHGLIELGEPVTTRKRILYILIECFQNIIYHSDGFPDGSKLAYLLVTKKNQGFHINTCNTIKKTSTENLSNKINNLLKKDQVELSKIFDEKLEGYIDKNEGYGGLGLVTILSKSKKMFNYKINNITENFALFELNINLNNKINSNG